MSMSMDVLFHLPDDRDYFEYLDHLFNSAVRHVVIYSTDTPDGRPLVMSSDASSRRTSPKGSLTGSSRVLNRRSVRGLATFFVYGKVGL